MSFIRPEARAALWRWREVLAGLGAAALGAWWILGPGGLLGWIGWILVLTGAVGVVAGMQRGRFRTAGQGPGVVQIDEGQIAYFGPLSGGVAPMAEIERLTYCPNLHPEQWLLESPGRPPLAIPVNADGAEALFDAFAALPGLKMERLLAEMHGHSPHAVVIWEKRSTRRSVDRLH